MSAPWARDLAPLEYTDFDDWNNVITITPGVNPVTSLCLASALDAPAAALGLSFGPQLKPYQKVCIASLAMAWSAAGNNYLTWSLLVNGKPDPRYSNVSWSLAQPYGDTIYLPQPYWVPALARLDFSVTLQPGASGPVQFTGRIIPFYFVQNPNLMGEIARPGRKHMNLTQGPRNVGGSH